MISSSTTVRSTPARLAGFTLIEVMIVVVVIAILAAVAYPSYESYILRSNRSAAQQLMMAIASRQEQFMLDQRTYTSTLGGTAAGSLRFTEDGWDCTSDTTQCTTARYTVTVAIAAGPPPTYVITATPTGVQVKDGATPLTLDNLGTKSPLDKWKK